MKLILLLLSIDIAGAGICSNEQVIYQCKYTVSHDLIFSINTGQFNEQ